jgi:hypothetical protein
VEAGRSVYFASLADIIGALAKAERVGQDRLWPLPARRPKYDQIGFLTDHRLVQRLRVQHEPTVRADADRR